MRVKSLTVLMQIAGNTAARDQVYDLSLASKYINDQHVKLAATFPNLQTLDVSGVMVTDEAIESLRNHQSLENLYLSGTKVGNNLAALASLPRLRDLNLQHCPGSNRGVATIGMLKDSQASTSPTVAIPIAASASFAA